MDKWLAISFKLGLCCIWLFLGLGVLNLPRSVTYEQNYPVIVYQMTDENFLEETEINLKGTLTKRLFSGKKFSGIIKYQDVLSNEMKVYSVWFKKDCHVNRLSGRVETLHSQLGAHFQFLDVIASIHLSHDLKKMALLFKDNTQLMMTGPSSTRDEAMEIYHEIFQLN